MVTTCLCVLGLASLTQAAWVNAYTEDFEGLNTGDLDGQNGWQAITEDGVGVVDTVGGSDTRAMGQTAAEGEGWYRKGGVNDYSYQDIKISARLLSESTTTGKSNPTWYFYFRNKNNAAPESDDYVRFKVYRQWVNDSTGYRFRCEFGTEDGRIGDYVTLLSSDDGAVDLTVSITAVGTALETVISYTGGDGLYTLSRTTDAAHVYEGGTSFRMICPNYSGGTGKFSMDDLALDYVPEPATLGVLAVGGCLALLRRRR
jgi:hypothetical protein